MLIHDPEFLADPGRHPAIFSDHPVVHVRDVAIGLVGVLDTIDGVLLPGRSASRLLFVKALGVAVAYLHDIGMVDMTPAGRRDHGLYAAHEAFGACIDPLVDHLLAPGAVRTRLDAIDAAEPFAVPLETVVRELLSLSVAHSKSAVPAAVLNDRIAFRRLLQRVVLTSLADHRAMERRPSAADTSPLRAEVNLEWYDDPAQFSGGR